MATIYRDFVAGPPTVPTRVGDDACMITGGHTIVGDRVAEVRIYARRGIEFVRVEYTWGEGDITAMSTRAVELTKAVLAAELN